MKNLIIGGFSVFVSMSMFGGVAPEKASLFTAFVPGVIAAALAFALCYSYDALFESDAR